MHTNEVIQNNIHKVDPLIETWTGVLIDITNPFPSDINIKDIAHSLSMQCRFIGHVDRFYSVAEHSVNVAAMVSPKNRLAALLHDAVEAYLSDIASPIKRLLPDYYVYEHKLQEVIANTYMYEYPFDPEIKQADNAALLWEAEHLMRSKGNSWAHLYSTPLKFPPWVSPLCLSPEEAEEYFLFTFEGAINARKQEEDGRDEEGVRG